MVIDIRHIGGGFLALVLLLGSLSYYFDAQIVSKSDELNGKRELATTLSKLESKWSKKTQKIEIEKLKKLLNVFDIEFTQKDVRKRKVFTMQLNKTNLDKVLAMIVNRNIDIKKLKIERVDKHIVNLEVEII